MSAENPEEGQSLRRRSRGTSRGIRRGGDGGRSFIGALKTLSFLPSPGNNPVACNEKQCREGQESLHKENAPSGHMFSHNPAQQS
mmetsp:Transcript_46386/g.108379  ORF Transcript_46386/g.108379 Transcript_46386/m.108379 type:complete len:85 (-) Transcript_46386:484-738(-)